MRNICFTKAYEDYFNKDAIFCLFYFNDNHFKTAINVKEKKPLSGLERKIRNKNIFKYFSYQGFIEKAIEICSAKKEKRVWKELLTWIKIKGEKVIAAT